MDQDKMAALMGAMMGQQAQRQPARMSDQDLSQMQEQAAMHAMGQEIKESIAQQQLMQQIQEATGIQQAEDVLSKPMAPPVQQPQPQSIEDLRKLHQILMKDPRK
ncbi:MAG: hypothetical protein DRI98_10665 [Bacteroidetes bacterium]|nr:MAG: hypothetical protein DRI98_10665 [Bacteroidota bacterium]